MRKIILIHGLIAGVIVSAIMLISYPLMKNGILNAGSGMIIGYSSMVISLSVIFFAIKTYRDRHLNGSISFGKAFQVGILIAAIGSLMYAGTWQVFSYTVATDFTEFYTEHQINDLKSHGATANEVAIARKDMEDFAKMYENPVIRFAMTIMEIFPVGLVISLIAAAILRKRQFLPA
jgi:hypothetical protein